ncbi:MAG: hypothetical protein ACRDQA_19440 [Nocardioidaceae bacterium]
MSGPTGTRTRVLAGLLLGALLAGCGLPHHKDLSDLSKRAVTRADASEVTTHLNQTRGRAQSDLDETALGKVERGSLLAIDLGRFRVRRTLGLVESAPTRIDPADKVLTPRFDRYPMWFAEVSTIHGSKSQVVALFTRASTTAPWRLAFAPRMAPSTKIPRVARNDDRTATAVRPEDGSGLPASPQAIVDGYARYLGDPHADASGRYIEDSFVSQMRELQPAQSLDHVVVTRQWTAQPVHYVLRLPAGGALVFATLVRKDRFRVRGDHALSWPLSAEPAAYFRTPLRRSATLTYNHQVAMVVPKGGHPVVIGQYGGLVAATGH